MHGAQFMDHFVAPVLPLDAFERFTFDQIFTPSDFESADLDSEVEAEVERESEAESRRPAAPPTDDEGEADVESQSDADRGLLARAQYLHSDEARATTITGHWGRTSRGWPRCANANESTSRGWRRSDHRIIAKIKFWISSAAFTLSRHSDNPDEKLAAGAGGQKRSGESAATTAWDEKHGLVVADEREDSDGRRDGDGGPATIMLSLPAVGAIATTAAALEFRAGVTVDGQAGLLTSRSL